MYNEKKAYILELYICLYLSVHQMPKLFLGIKKIIQKSERFELKKCEMF